jgi:hypothetical protein
MDRIGASTAIFQFRAGRSVLFFDPGTRVKISVRRELRSACALIFEGRSRWPITICFGPLPAACGFLWLLTVLLHSEDNLIVQSGL